MTCGVSCTRIVDDSGAVGWSVMGIGTHQTRGSDASDDWITPRHIIERLGPFDLDPCESVTQPWPMAHRGYTVRDDGLSKPWNGVVWLNPPYGQQTGQWLNRLAEHGAGVALVFARTETDFFFRHVWPRASGLLFLRGRLHFCYPDGRRASSNSGAPSVLVAYSEECSCRLQRCGLDGHFVGLLPAIPGQMELEL